MRQLDAFEPQKGKALKDAGIKSAIDHEHEDWKQEYRLRATTYVTFLDHGTLFTSEQVRAEVLRRQPDPHHPNVWGAMFNGVLKQWIKGGLVVPTGQVIDATNSQAHRRAIRLYRRV